MLLSNENAEELPNLNAKLVSSGILVILSAFIFYSDVLVEKKHRSGYNGLTKV